MTAEKTSSNSVAGANDSHVSGTFVRPATVSDAADIARIYNQAVTHSTATFDQEPKSAEDRAVWLEAHGPRRPVVVAVEGDEVVGWGSLSDYSERCAYEGTVEISTYIDEHHVGRGLGTLLASALIEDARELGIHVILSRICTENTASLAMAGRLGFREVGVMHEVGNKFGRWLDVALFELVLRA